MRFVKTISFFLFVFLLTALNTIIVCNAETYTDSSCGASFAIPDSWHEDSWRASAEAEYNMPGYRDGCVVYSMDFVPGSDSSYDHNIRFGYKDLMSGSSRTERANYQTADFVAEIESLRDDNTRMTATSDEAKRVITDLTDKTYLSVLVIDEHEMMTIGKLEYVCFDEYDSRIYVHVHNGVVYQFKEEGAEKEIKEMLASAKYPDNIHIKPTEKSTTKRSSSTESSGFPFGNIGYLVFFAILIVFALIKSVRSKAGQKTKVISIRMANSDTDDGDDSDAEDDSSDNEKE